VVAVLLARKIPRAPLDDLLAELERHARERRPGSIRLTLELDQSGACVAGRVRPAERVHRRALTPA
jgi:hypothetical protein